MPFLCFYEKQDPTITQDQCVFIRGFRVKRALFQIRLIRIGSSRDDKNPQRSPYRNNSVHNASSFLGDGSHIGGSSSNLDTIGPPINYENPQLRPYTSSTDIQSNGDLCNASFMTSPNDNSLIEPNDIAEVCPLGMIARSNCTT
jgi:hypothetical protein